MAVRLATYLIENITGLNKGSYLIYDAQME